MLPVPLADRLPRIEERGVPSYHSVGRPIKRTGYHVSAHPALSAIASQSRLVRTAIRIVDSYLLLHEVNNVAAERHDRSYRDHLADSH